MRIGYARVSTLDQNPDLQLEKLRGRGARRSSSKRLRAPRPIGPSWNRVLHDILREGDTLVVWKLDRLARSLKQLIETAADLKGRGIGLVSLNGRDRHVLARRHARLPYARRDR
jgi:DNA invertase Pin-like site-specific DNA recombinase